MIFIAVGTQKFQLNRLLRKMDELIKNGIITEQVFAQIGNSDYIPENYQYEKFLDKSSFDEYIRKSSLIITHSGVGTIISAINCEKPVIVFPRLAKYGEHVDDHQTEIAESFSKQKLVLMCGENDKLEDIIQKSHSFKFRKYISHRDTAVSTVRNYLKRIENKSGEIKISVITLHRVRNYGSSLQTLATQDYLKSKGCDVQIIDYYPERYTSLGLLKRLKYKSRKLAENPVLLFGARCIISVSYIKKKIIFDGFLKKYINLTPQTYRTERQLIKNLPEADAYCTGSDQVWNSFWNEGVDRPLYLSFVPDSKFRFSYSASIGNSRLSENEKKKVKPLLEKYKFISVRENAGVDIIKDIGIDNVQQVLDPTLLFDSSHWKKYASSRFRGQKYILTYNLHHDKRIDQYAKNLGKKYRCKVYNISYNIHDIIRSGKLKWCPSVEEYLGLIKEAEFVVTDSFHATVFSLIFHTDFAVIYPEQASSRLRSILELTGLSSRGFEKMPSVSLADKPVDFRRVDSILRQERIKSDKYINTVIGAINDNI